MPQPPAPRPNDTYARLEKDDRKVPSLGRIGEVYSLLGCCSTVGGDKVLISVEFELWIFTSKNVWKTCGERSKQIDLWSSFVYLDAYSLSTFFSMFVWPYWNILKHHFDTVSIFVQMFFQIQVSFCCQLMSHLLFFLSHPCVSHADLAWCQPCTAKRSLSKTTQGFGSGIPLGWDLEEPKMYGS